LNAFYLDILSQPAALRGLLSEYNPGSDRALSSIPCPSTPIFTGMGSSYHAALAASIYLHNLGVRAQAMETTHLLYYGGPILERCREVIYLSQSGASAEVIPFIDRLECGRVFLAITNNLDSPLARRAEHVLPLGVLEETLVASKTYLNSLALLWLLARFWTGKADGSEFEQLEHVAACLETALEHEKATTAAWLDFFKEAHTLICTGHGPHVATALQAAQTLAEWTKIPALGLSAGALRHGFVEVAAPGVGVIVFSGSGPAQAVSLRLAGELASYGARALLVENGRSFAVRPLRHRPLAGGSGSEFTLEPMPGEEFQLADEFLALLLDILPVQLFSVALAQQRGIPPGFRYLEKVVHDL
jgi:glucosamine--fructose-6-phosphate aminotransferase (isomerizing)